VIRAGQLLQVEFTMAQSLTQCGCASGGAKSRAAELGAGFACSARPPSYRGRGMGISPTYGISGHRRIAEAAEELSWIAPEHLRGEIDALVARVHAKLAAVSERPVKRQTARVNNVTDHSRAMSLMIEMKIGAWEIDEHGVRSRMIWNADGPPP
jgi:hypothetical protein